MKKSPSLLLGDIQAHLLKRIDQPSDRRQDILHPSEMAKSDWCPRQSWYRLSGAEPSNPVKNHGHQLENIFDEGHQIHDKWQQRIWDMGRLWGKFACLVCGHVWFDTSPQECPNGTCGSGRKVLVYREVPVDGEEKYLIAGHEDGAVLDIKALIEIKSIGQGTLRMEDPGLLSEYLVETVDGKKVYDLDGIWKNLKRPLPSHIRQTGIYLKILQENGIDVDKVVYLYEYKANQSVKEFVTTGVPRAVEPLLDSALDIKYALAKGREIPRPDDRHRESKGCKECPWMKECWGDEPTGTEKGDAGDDVGPERPRRGRRRSAEQAVGGPARPARRARTSAAEGPDRTRRQRAHEPVRGDDELVDVHREPAGHRGGRRVVRRSRREALGGGLGSD